MFNRDILSQVTYVEAVLIKSPVTREVLTQAAALGLPNWYLGAGAIANTVWNELHGYPFDYGLKDCDLVYFDPDTSQEAQDRWIQKGKETFRGLSLEVEITNEARVHLWYEQEFGKAIDPFASTEDAINTWPTTATALGVRYDGKNFSVYAPYGLSDLLSMIVRPNKRLITQQIYEKKVERFQ